MGFLPKILNLVYVENRGAAFSIFEGKSFLLIGVAIIFLIVILYVIFTKKLSIAYINVLTLISAGCIGNLYDRISLGYVRDFFEFDFIKFPVFNVADIYITLAALYLIILIFTDRRDNANNK